MAANYKIAVISDIHSNFVALRAIMDELNKEGVDEIAVAGDNIGLFVQPNETVDLLREKNARMIHGNSEDYLRSYIDGTNAHWLNFHQMKPLVWTHDTLTVDNTDFLLNLPPQRTFSVHNTSFRMVHGSINRVDELIYKHENDKIKNGLAAAKEKVLICGHSHQQWHRRVEGTLIVNPGSAGISYMGKGVAPYSVISHENGIWSVKEHRAIYDVDEVACEMEKAAIEHYAPWAKMLLHSITDGKVATIAFIEYAKQYALSNGWDGNHPLIPNEHWHSAYKEFDWENFVCRFKSLRAN